ncbi:immunity 22 family protein [Paenibacillus sp. TY11]|uniref:immunity 22 family protein n=1 Tax=Paenibacillus sp. TY11 TaxID=3448633 RepID=UPI004039B99B
MEKEGFVSLWMGNVDTCEELERLLATSYTDEGDFIPSIFARYFEIDRYDDAVREAEYYEESSNDLISLLEGFSYDDKIIPEFNALLQGKLLNNFNAVILLYNFKYTGNREEVENDSNFLKYLGTVEYK